MKIDRVFEKLNAKIPHKNNKAIIKFVVIIFYLYVIIWIICDIERYCNEKRQSSQFIISTIQFIAITTHLCVTCNVCIYMMLLKQRFNHINEIILEKVRLTTKSQEKFELRYIKYRN